MNNDLWPNNQHIGTCTDIQEPNFYIMFFCVNTYLVTVLTACSIWETHLRSDRMGYRHRKLSTLAFCSLSTAFILSGKNFKNELSNNYIRLFMPHVFSMNSNFTKSKWELHQPNLSNLGKSIFHDWFSSNTAEYWCMQKTWYTVY